MLSAGPGRFGGQGLTSGRGGGGVIPARGRVLRALWSWGRGLTHAAFLSLPVEVYNCAMGSPDCSQCLGREDLGHLCVWSDGCRLRGPLQPLPGTCPAPEIRAVSKPPPSYGGPSCPRACLCDTHGCLLGPSDLWLLCFTWPGVQSDLLSTAEGWAPSVP